MADCYVDDTNGTDAGGTAGTSGDPYASIQYALDNFASWSTSVPNTLWLANTSAFVLTSPIDFDTTVANNNYPLGVRAWDNGGSITGTGPWGQTISPCAEIDGNDAVTGICDNSTGYTSFFNIKMHSTTNYVVNLYNSYKCTVMNCEIYDGGTIGTATAPTFINCRVYYTAGAGGTCIQLGDGGLYGCEMFGGDEGVATTRDVPMIGNYIHDCDDSGINTSGNHMVLAHNTIDGTGSTSSNARGIEVVTSTYKHHIVMNNLVTNFDDVSQVAIYAGGTGGRSVLIGNNAFYNNTTDVEGNAAIDLTASDITETSDPYTNLAGDDFSLVSGALSNDAAIATNENRNIGAWQEKPAGGGGGGGETSHVSFS